MVTLATIIPFLDQGVWFSALDLRDPYFHIMIQPSHRRFLRFTLDQDHFQYRVLPFRLSSGPKVFSKVLSVIAAHLHKLRIMIYPYLDDCLLKAWSFDGLSATPKAIDVFMQLSMQLNTQKWTGSCATCRIHRSLSRCNEGQSLPPTT